MIRFSRFERDSIFRISLIFIPLFAFFAGSALAIQPDEDVFYPIPQNLTPNDQPEPTDDLVNHDGYAEADSDDVMTINAYLYKPNGVDDDEELPTVILLHGSSSLWSNRDMANGISFQYREWAEELTDRGYLVIMPDSYHLRGISDGFSNRKPSTDPDQDDALCSPNYERPKDVVATLQYLATRDDVDVDNIGVLAFSQGAQTALNSVLDPGIDLSPYEESCVGQNNPRPAPDPVRIPNNLPFPKVVAVYYPGCGFFDYHGSPHDTGPNRFMPDTRTKVLMFHGTEDSLMDDDFPVKCVAASRAHAFANNFDDPFIYHYVFEGADHSFDNYSVQIEPEANWWTDEESDDEAAKRIARKETLRQFGHRLKGEPYLIVPKFPDIGNGEVNSPTLLKRKIRNVKKQMKKARRKGQFARTRGLGKKFRKLKLKFAAF